MTINEMKARAEEIDSLIAPLESEKRKLSQEIAVQTCPFSVGDVLERSFRYGYRHPPVYRTERARVVSIHPTGFSQTPNIRLKVIRKDGTLGVHPKLYFKADNWKLVQKAESGSN